MGIPIILGASESIKRKGGTFRARCPRCGQDVKMYEAVKHTNINAFLAISLWDDEAPVVQCGECLAVYGEEDAVLLRDGVAAASTAASARAVPAPRTAPAKRPVIDERAIDDELAAMKKRLGK